MTVHNDCSSTMTVLEYAMTAQNVYACVISKTMQTRNVVLCALEYTYHCDLVQWGLTTETASIGFIRLLTVRK